MSGESQPRNRRELSRRAVIGFVAGAEIGLLLAGITVLATSGVGAPVAVWLAYELGGLMGGGILGAGIGAESERQRRNGS